MSTARAIQVGTPVTDFPLEDSVVINFHDFANLPAGREQCVHSPLFSCAGYDWLLRIYPGGHSVSRGMIGFFLGCAEDVVANYRVFLLKSNGNTYKSFVKNNGITFDFVNRGEILKKSNHFLNNGALSFLVHIKPNKEYIIRLRTHNLVLLTIFSTSCLMTKKVQMWHST